MELKDPKFRPEILSKVSNITVYDVIFVGFPIWWGANPNIINTFLEAHNLEGKTIVPFCTSGGSPVGKTLDRLKPSAPKAIWKEAKLLNNPTKATILNWLEALDL